MISIKKSDNSLGDFAPVDCSGLLGFLSSSGQRETLLPLKKFTFTPLNKGKDGANRITMAWRSKGLHPQHTFRPHPQAKGRRGEKDFFFFFFFFFACSPFPSFFLSFLFV